MRRILFALALLVAPGVAEAIDETCHFTSSGSWSSATAYSGTDDCTLDANDAIVIDSGVTATITGDITQGGGASIGVTVASGGTLVAAVGAGVDSGTLLAVTLGASGLNCAAGSTCNLSGAYPTLSTTPTLASSPSTTTYWQFGDPVPCPGADCTLMRISYPTATYNAATGTALDTGIDQSIAALAAGDILCFWNPSGAATFGTPDVNACYPISAVSGGGSPYTIDFSVRLSPTGGVVNKQQDIYTTTLSAAATTGARTLSVDGATIGTGEESYFVGRWARLEKASGGTYEASAYRILRVTDGGGGGATPDTITLASLDGIAHDYASGDDLAIDYGWRTGDPMLIYRPVKLTSATATGGFGDSEVAIYGTSSLTGVHMVQLRGLRIGGAALPATTTVTDLFMQESEWGVGSAASIKLDTISALGAVTFNRTVLIGLPNTHGFSVIDTTPVGAQSMTIVDSLARYGGDDCVVVDPTTVGSVSMTRLRCQWGAVAPSTSQNLIDSANSAVAFTASQVECLDCTSHDSANTEVFLPATSSAGTMHVDGALLYGIRSAVHKGDWADGQTSISNMAIIGGGTTALSSSNWLTPIADKFVVREVETTSNGAYLQNQGIQTTKVALTNGLVVGFSQAGTAAYAMKMSTTAAVPDTIRNVAFVDLLNANANSSALILQSTTRDDSVYQNITIAYRPNFTAASGVVRGIELNDTTPAFTLSDSLFTGLLRTSAVGIYAASAATFADPLVRDHLCFAGNTGDISASAVASLSADSSRDRPFLFVDPARRRFGGVLGSLERVTGCGATPSAGITKYQWIHAISGLEPENLGTLGSQGGSSGWLPRAF